MEDGGAVGHSEYGGRWQDRPKAGGWCGKRSASVESWDELRSVTPEAAQDEHLQVPVMNFFSLVIRATSASLSPRFRITISSGVAMSNPDTPMA